MQTCALIFPHQLFANHPALDRTRLAVLCEDSLFFGDARYPARFHVQKLIFHRASMKAYGAQLARRRQETRYVEYVEGKTARDLINSLAADGIKEIAWADPVDDILERRVRQGCAENGIQLTTYPSPMFLTPVDWGLNVLGDQPPYRMQSFYIAQRKRMNLLLDGEGRPVGAR